jgi:hypothetical protein
MAASPFQRCINNRAVSQLPPLKGSFISLTELTEYTEKDNYPFLFAAEAPANENRYAWQGIGCQNLPPKAD